MALESCLIDRSFRSGVASLDCVVWKVVSVVGEAKSRLAFNVVKVDIEPRSHDAPTDISQSAFR